MRTLSGRGPRGPRGMDPEAAVAERTEPASRRIRSFRES